MKRATKLVIALGTALTLGLGAAAISAQPFGYGPGWGMGPGMMGGYGGQGWGGRMGGYGPGYGMGPGMMGGCGGQAGGGRMGGHGPGHAGERLARLKIALGITAQQDVAWQAFAKNAKQQSENRQAWFAKMREARDGAKSAPEMLAQRSEFMKQRQLEMAANVAAFKDLYAALTPEQKVIADQRFGGFGPGRIQGNRTGPRGYAR